MTKIKNFSPYNVIKEGLSKLKPNEKKVIDSRFGIEGERKTLSAIGRELDLSRERIRQIEKDGLKKLAGLIVEQKRTLVEKIVEAIDKAGGLASNDNIAEKFLENHIQKSRNEFNSLHLLFVLMPDLIKIEKTKELEEAWILASISREDMLSVITDWVKHLKKIKTPQTIEVLLDNHPNHRKHKMAFLSELPAVSRKLVKTDTGLIGLSSWPEVNPKNIRDKIYYILKKINKPLHFGEIADMISKQRFDSKKVVRATVHNELIADNRFVLIGRGIYALTEWGYKEGTVADIIQEILNSKKDGLTADSIIEGVLKQRAVKKNTILINLQTKPIFKKINDRYFLA